MEPLRHDRVQHRQAAARVCRACCWRCGMTAAARLSLSGQPQQRSTSTRAATITLARAPDKPSPHAGTARAWQGSACYARVGVASSMERDPLSGDEHEKEVRC